MLADPSYQMQNARRSLSRQLARSLTGYLEQWWVGECREMERAAAIGNGHNLDRLVGNTGSRKPSANEVIKESDGTLIHSTERRP